MGTVTTLPQSRPLTRADLDAMPDDGHRYELIDGSLIVTPAPGHLHQRAVLELAIRMRSGCPVDLEVLIAPFDVALADDTVMQPGVRTIGWWTRWSRRLSLGDSRVARTSTPVAQSATSASRCGTRIHSS
jgi:hypothetical protein